VASGDPLSDRVIIWTRVTPEDIGMNEVEVDWRVATDPSLSDIVTSGSFTTGPDRDYTVKIDVSGLQPATTYYYGFVYNNKASLTGRTRTTPAADESDHLKFAVVSCNNIQAGYFNAFKEMSKRNDIDAVIHLGDYIYEYADGVYGDSTLWDERPVDPDREIVTLDDYRRRYSTYRLDTSLMRAHQQHPFICVWDDHESANDAYVDGAENHDPLTQGDWEVRKENARKAYFEWIPIREDNSIYRTISYGDLLDLVMLDTRLEGREEQILDVTDSALYSPDRTILGTVQKNWLKNELITSQAKWKMIGQQVIFSPLTVGWAALQDPTATYEELESIFLDIWDGYPAERTELIEFIQEEGLENLIILTGDFHSAFAFEVVDTPNIVDFRELFGMTLPFYLDSDYDPNTGEGAIAVEFATPSISSANFDENVGFDIAVGFEEAINNPLSIPGISLGNPNPHMKGVDLIQHGYFVIDIKDDSIQSDFFFTRIDTPGIEEFFDQGWINHENTTKLEPANGPAAPKLVQDAPAPLNPPMLTDIRDIEGHELTILSVFPNPTQDYCTVQFSLRDNEKVDFSVFDLNGRLMESLLTGYHPKGLYAVRADLSAYPAGVYVLTFRIGEALKTTFSLSLRLN
jgi:alkaline phosphatase D